MRILAPDDDSDGSSRHAPRARMRRGIDYRELVREARLRSERAALREALRAHGERPPPAGAAPERDGRDIGPYCTASSAAGGVAACVDERDEPEGEDEDEDDLLMSGADGTNPHAALARAQARHEARERRIEAHAAPFVAALGIEQLRLTQLMSFVAAHVADFCSDDAVVENGNWSLTLKLDDALLPRCMLHLDLSRFCLTLRFDAASNSTRQLVSRHAHVLKEQLTNLLLQLDTPRDVSIETA
ncbi:type III secretion system protein SctP [Paraburkholderia strydomiana]|uniref:Type III secretion system protein SctP n=1 Tax=Paraburkholderia strydomiana TaxID=1245417 RepID=A0ABW9EPM3_9BURK